MPSWGRISYFGSRDPENCRLQALHDNVSVLQLRQDHKTSWNKEDLLHGPLQQARQRGDIFEGKLQEGGHHSGLDRQYILLKWKVLSDSLMYLCVSALMALAMARMLFPGSSLPVWLQVFWVSVAIFVPKSGKLEPENR